MFALRDANRMHSIDEAFGTLNFVETLNDYFTTVFPGLLSLHDVDKMTTVESPTQSYLG